MIGTDRLRLALAAHAAIGGPTRILAAVRSGGAEELEREYAKLHRETRERIARDVDELERQGVGVLLFGDDRYPARLEQLPTPPPILYYRGNVDLLEAPSIGMCGSRDASADGLEAARVAGLTVAGAGLTIISGNARGVDTEAHVAAIAAGGSTIIVLAEGIARFRVKRVLGDAGLEPGQLLVISQFPPQQGWTVGGAMMRNAIIAGLGIALVVIEAGDTGGTLDAGLKGLELERPVLALDFRSGERPGNAILFGKGARRVNGTRALTEAIRAIDQAVETGAQLPMFEAAATPTSPGVRGSL